jgi:hypothetical protein
MTAIKKYAKFLRRQKAYGRILEDLKPEVLRELKRRPDGKAAVDGVEFHITTKVTRRYPKDIQDILKDLQAQIDQQKKVAEESNKVTLSETATFDASIPKSAEDEVLSEVPDYKKHFGTR